MACSPRRSSFSCPPTALVALDSQHKPAPSLLRLQADARVAADGRQHRRLVESSSTTITVHGSDRSHIKAQGPRCLCLQSQVTQSPASNCACKLLGFQHVHIPC